MKENVATPYHVGYCRETQMQSDGNMPDSFEGHLPYTVGGPCAANSCQGRRELLLQAAVCAMRGIQPACTLLSACVRKRRWGAHEASFFHHGHGRGSGQDRSFGASLRGARCGLLEADPDRHPRGL